MVNKFGVGTLRGFEVIANIGERADSPPVGRRLMVIKTQGDF